MRRVQVSKRKFDHTLGPIGRYVDLPPVEGLFHAWGVDYEEFEHGVGNITMAIVEMPDGTVEKFLPERITFLDKPE